MNINGLKYRVKDDPSVHAFRFPTPTGTRRNLACHFADPEALQDAMEALIFAIEGQAGQRVNHVALQASDTNGDVWLIERHGTNVRYTLNGKTLGDEAVAKFRAALWDQDEGETESQPIAMFRLCPQAEDWRAEPMSLRGRQLISARDRWEKHFQESFAKAKGFLGASHEWTAAALIALAKRLESLNLQSREVSAAMTAMRADAPVIPIASLDALAQMEQEVELGQRIRTASQPFLDPANSPQVLRDKIQRLDQEISVLRDKIGPHQDIVERAPDIPWVKVLQVLSKMQAYALLVEATQDAIRRVDEELSPLLDDFTGTLDELMARDQIVIQELESCLITVSQKAQRAAERQEPGLGKVFDRLLSRASAEESHQAAAANHALEETRSAIDIALQRLGELHKSLITAEKTTSPGQALKEYHAKLSQEFLKLKDIWQQSVSHYKLAEDMTLKSMVALMQHAGTVIALEKERQSLAERLNRYRQDLKTLEALILEWRQIAHSAKATTLDTPALIIAETRSILQLCGVKEAQLKKLKQDESLLKTQQNLHAYWQRRQAALDKNWHETQTQAGLPGQAMNATFWEAFFQEAARLAILEAHRTDPRKALKQDEIFSDRSLAYPLAFFLWPERSTENRDRLRLLELIEKAPHYGYGLIFVSDPILADMTAKLGVSVSQEMRKAAVVDSEPSISQSPGKKTTAILSARANQKPESHVGRGSDDELQERARTALRMLTGGKHDLLG